MSKNSVLFNRSVLTLLSAIALTACGGGSSIDSGSVSLTGTVATGAPVVSGTVTVFDASGTQVGTGSITTDGGYSLSVPDSAKAPFILKATFDGQELYSVKTTASNGVANISQLTNAVVAMVSPSGDLSVLTSEMAAGAAISSDSVAASIETLQSALAPATQAIQASGETVDNFLTGSFSADGTGIDKLLDTSKIGLTSAKVDGKNLANIELSFNSALKLDDPNAAEPKGFTFAAASSVSEVQTSAAAVTIDKSDLPPKELASLYRNFLDRMQACYALPASSRGTKGSGATWSFTVSTQQCKDVFFESDPTQFKDGGFGVGYKRFYGLPLDGVKIYPAATPVMLQNIRPDANGVLDGRALVAVRGEDDEGNYVNSTIVVKMFTLNGERVMGAYGDQNATEFYVNSELAVVNHPLTDGSNDYVSSAYAIYLPATYPGKTVSYAELKTPKGNTIYMGKDGNRSTLRICTDQTNKTGCTKTPNLLQGLRYLSQARHDAGEGPFQLANLRKNFSVSRSASNTSCPQFNYTGSTDWGVSVCPRTDSEIEDQRAGGLWTAIYHFSDNTASAPLYTRHSSRALSNRELVSSTGPDNKAAKLTAETITRFQKYTDDGVASGRALSSWKSDATAQSPIWSPASGGFLFEWAVTEGQVAPRQIFMTGAVQYIDIGGQRKNFTTTGRYETVTGVRYYYPNEAVTRPNWDEIYRFKSSLRSKEMICSPLATTDDISCDGSSGGTWRTIQDNSGTATTFTLTAQSGATIANNYTAFGLFGTVTGQTGAAETPIVSGTSENFAPGSWMSYANLWTKDENQRNLTRGYNFYNPY